ncbi:MAG: hypothetical protein H0U18_02300 [Pyrinomonadaceae bacterium]|nr:hypothetical protein [Pyrinomonadaceae bacterium]
MNTKVLNELSRQSLRALAASLRDGPLSSGLTRYPLQQISGSRASELEKCLKFLAEAGMTSSQVALLVEAVEDATADTPNLSDVVDLVLSGPEVAGVPTSDTLAILRRLIDEATSEVLLVGYAVHQGKQVFGRLAARMDEKPELRVWLCLDISRKQTDTSLSQEIVRRFAHDFRGKHWPGKRLPELYFDPRSLSENRDKRSSLHAKCIAIDRRVALITSANFTEAAQQRNIEAGVIVKYPLLVERLVGYFEGLQTSGQLVGCSLK